nr:hypothetical protein [Tanacetum cinerariifolium]
MAKPHSELSPQPHQWFWRKGIHMVRVSGGDEHVVALDFNGYLSALIYRRMDSEEFYGKERMVSTSAATVLVVERDSVSQGCERESTLRFVKERRLRFVLSDSVLILRFGSAICCCVLVMRFAD